jgi:hypothetical protein
MHTFSDSFFGNVGHTADHLMDTRLFHFFVKKSFLIGSAVFVTFVANQFASGADRCCGQKFDAVLQNDSECIR